MSRVRTSRDIDAVDETDKSGAVGAAPELPDAPKPVPAGHLRVRMHARRTNPAGGEPFPPGEYDLPKEEALQFIRVGAAKLVV